MHRVKDPADPNRCQHVFPHEQCWNHAALGSDKCEVHAGNIEQPDEINRRLYHLTEARYRTRLAQLDEHDHLRTLRDQIALASRLIERRFNLIRDDIHDAELIESCGPWNTLLLTKERLVRSVHQIEQNLGVLQSKNSVLALGQLIIQITLDELQGIDNYNMIVATIQQQIMQAITTAKNHAPILPIAMPLLLSKGKDAPTFLIEDAKEQLRVAQLSKHERIKSLNEDIALQIIMIERRWNSVKNDIDLQRASQPICEMLKTLDRLIKTAHEVEQTLGYLLDRETLLRLGKSVGQIIARHLRDTPDRNAILDRIMSKIALTLVNENRRIEAQKILPKIELSNAKSILPEATSGSEAT